MSLKKRFNKKTPPFFARLSKKLNAIALSSAALGIAIFAEQDKMFPLVVEIGKIATTIGCFGSFAASLIAQLTTSDDSETTTNQDG